MKITTKNFGEVVIDDDKIITFPGGIVGFPDLKSFTLIHNEEKDKVNSVHWLQSLDEPAFAMPVLDPLLVEENYNPEVEYELLKPLGELNPEEMLVLVTLTVPKDVKAMSVNLRAPIVINSENRLACQIILDSDQYAVKYPIYEKLNAKKQEAGAKC